MAYLTYTEYLARFGERETIILTNEMPNGTQPDSAKVGKAIDDADDVVEAYIGARYVVPIATPPSVVKGWTAALAREALYVNVGRVSDAVTLAADRARSQLRDVQAGRMSLPVPEGGTPPEMSTPQGSAQSSNDREQPIFSGTNAFAGFGIPFGGSDLPCWRRGT